MGPAWSAQQRSRPFFRVKEAGQGMMAESNTELEQITLGEFQDRLLRLCLHSGMRGLPRRRRDQHILLKSVVLTFDRTEEYTEDRVNQKLQSWLDEVGCTIELDHVRLRRHLVDAEYLGRSRDGSRYWVAVLSRKQYRFDSAVEDLDVYGLVRQQRYSG
jgi:hypothetical protein